MEVLELISVVLSLLDDDLYLVDVQQVKKLEHTDLPVFDFAKHGKREYTDERDHPNRDEADQINEQVVVARGLFGILKHVLCLEMGKRSDVRQSVVVYVIEVLEQLRHFLSAIQTSQVRVEVQG